MSSPFGFRIPVPPTVDDVQRDCFKSALNLLIETYTATVQPDEELVMYYITGPMLLRVLHVAIKGTGFVILQGVDADNTKAAAFGHATSVQFQFRVEKKQVAQPERRKSRIGFTIDWGEGKDAEPQAG